MKPLSIGILLLSGTLISSQLQSPSQPPFKVDSYNDKIHSSEAEQWRLEDFREKLLKEPEAKAYIIAQGGREDNPGKAKRYALRAKNWLVELRGIDSKRIVAIDGGRREEFIVDLWIVPNNSHPPTPSPSIDVTMDPSDNLLYDEFEVGYDNFASRSEDAAARLDGFAETLKKEPKSWGCVVAFAENGDDRMGMEWDPPGEALRIARRQKQYLVRKHGFTLSKLTAVDGGYAGRTVELWVMRPGARFDKGPFIYPNRLKAKGRGILTLNKSYNLDLCCKACIRSGTDPYVLRNGERHKPK